MADREKIIAAHNSWRTAHRAYRDEVAKHLVWHMESGTPPEHAAEPLTPKTLDKLSQLLAAERVALDAYRESFSDT